MNFCTLFLEIPVNVEVWGTKIYNITLGTRNFENVNIYIILFKLLPKVSNWNHRVFSVSNYSSLEFQVTN